MDELMRRQSVFYSAHDGDRVIDVD